MSQGAYKTKDECTLYVSVKGSKLPDDIGKWHLLQHFQGFSSSIVNVELVSKKEKRYAFIKFMSGDTATAAMQSLQGSLLIGRYLLTINYGQKTVAAMQPQPEAHSIASACAVASPALSQRESSQSGIQQYSDMSATSSLVPHGSAVVGNYGSADSGYVLCVRVRNSKFPGYIRDDDLKSHFAEFQSEMVDGFIRCNPQTGESCGYGFVVFTSHYAAKTAMRQLQGSKLHDRFSLYIRFDGLRRLKHLRPYDTEREVPLQLPFEKLLYLKHCFFILPTALSTALLRSLPVKLALRHESIMLYGTSAAVWKATSLISENPLVHNLKSSCVIESWGALFVGFLQDKYLNPINEERRNVQCILRKNQENSQQDQITFNVYIFSHDHEVLDATTKKLKVC